MKDIESRADIDLVMRVFYERALADDVIGYIFTDVARLDLEAHLPVIVDFWESMLFATNKYQMRGRNPLLVHKDLDDRSRFRAEHFTRWLALFEKVVDEEFTGPRADLIKQRANAIANRFQDFLSIERDREIIASQGVAIR